MHAAGRKLSSCTYGYTNENPIGGRIPIAGAAGDQQAALFGQCCFEYDVKNTYGVWLLYAYACTGEISRVKPLLTTIAVKADGTLLGICPEGSAFVAGAAIQWLRDEVGILESSRILRNIVRWCWTQTAYTCGSCVYRSRCTILGSVCKRRYPWSYQRQEISYIWCVPR